MIKLNNFWRLDSMDDFILAITKLFWIAIIVFLLLVII